MALLSTIAKLQSGTPQFRIHEVLDEAAPTYTFFAQADLEEDMGGVPPLRRQEGKCIRTLDEVSTVAPGDVVFSLLSGAAVMVSPWHDGYLLTQNYVTLVPSSQIDRRYLVYLLNEDKRVRRQLRQGRQGSATMKYTLRQLNEVEIPNLPSLERQALMGETYLNQLKLAALKKRVSDYETLLVLEAIGAAK